MPSPDAGPPWGLGLSKGLQAGGVREGMAAWAGRYGHARWDLIFLATLRSLPPPRALEAFDALCDMALRLDRLGPLADEVDRWTLAPEALAAAPAATVIEILSLLIHENRPAGLAREIHRQEIALARRLGEASRLATLLPALMESGGVAATLADLNAAGIAFDRVACTPEWAAAVADLPLGLLPLCNEAHAQAWRAIDSFPARLAVFLFEWHVLGHLRVATLAGFFTLRQRHKQAWLKAIRRGTVALHRLSKESDRFQDYARLVRDPLDLVFLCTLGVRLDGAAFTQYLLDNRLGLEPPERAYCLSQCRIPLAGYRLINQRLREAGACALQPGFPTSIRELFALVASSAVGLPPAEDLGAVTVVMTTRNPDAELMQAAVDSIAAQDYPNLELVVVDDGSSQPVSARFETRPGRAFRIVRNDESVGPYVSRNRAIAASAGRFIAFQDDDDVSHPQRLSLQVRQLVAGAGRIVSAQHIRFDERGRLQMDLGTSFLSDGPVTMVMARQTFEELGGFLQVRSRGDVEYRARCIARFGAAAYVAVPAPLYYALGKGDTLSSRYENSDHHRLRMQRRLIHARQEQPWKT